MARTKTPEPRKMTHTHLLALAFKGIDAEIGYWEEKQQTTDNLYTIAKDIFDHSDTEGAWEELTISFIMYALNREAVITNYIIEGE